MDRSRWFRGGALMLALCALSTLASATSAAGSGSALNAKNTARNMAQAATASAWSGQVKAAKSTQDAQSRAAQAAAAQLGEIGVRLAQAKIEPRHTQSQIFFDSSGSDQAGYGQDQLITISGNLTYHGRRDPQTEGGSPDLFFAAADVYILPNGYLHTTTARIPLKDVSEVPNTIQARGGGGSFFEETIGATAYSGSISSGEYDVVVDEHQDGFFDPEHDLHLGEGAGAAFSVFVDVNAPGIPNNGIARVKFQAAQQFQQAALLSEVYRALLNNLLMTDRITNPFNTELSPGDNVANLAYLTELRKNFFLIAILLKKIVDENVCGQVCIQASSFSAIPFEAASTALANSLKNYTAIAADPPDPNFRHLVTLPEITPIEPTDSRPLNVAAAELANSLRQQEILSAALLAALEKYQGAAAAGDSYWALSHAREIQMYSNLLADHLGRTSEVFGKLRSTLATDTRNFERAAAEMKAIQDRVREQGFTLEERKSLLGLGATEEQIEQLRQDVLDDDYSFDRNELLAALDQQIQTDTEAAPAYRTLAAEMNAVIATLNSDLGSDKSQPVIRAGGPYSGTVGVPVNFNSAISGDPQGFPLEYAWDLDGDGEFDDATEISPSRTYSQPFDGYIGVQATNTAGKSAVSYAYLRVAPANARPEFTQLDPPIGFVRLAPGATQTFRAAATDPDGNPVTLEWFLDEQSVSTSGEFTYRPTDADVGAHVLRVRARDDRGEENDHTYLIAVVRPVAFADLSVTIADSPDPAVAGSDLTYTVTVTNSGPDAATNAELNFLMPPGLQVVWIGPGLVTQDDGVLSFNLGTIPGAGSPDNSKTATIMLRPAGAGEIGVVANVTSTSLELDADDNDADEATQVNSDTPERADLALTKVGSSNSVAVGNLLTYTLAVQNAGPDGATGLVVTDRLPDSVTFVSSTPSPSSQQGDVLTFNLADLADAASDIERITITVMPLRVGTITNTASVAANQGDPNYANNTATQSTTVTDLPANQADLAVLQTVSPEIVTTGDSLTYTITVTNNGPNDATGVLLTDSLPNSAAFVSASASQGAASYSAGVMTANLGTLAAGARTTVAMVVNTLAPGTLINSVTVTGAETDLNISNNSATLQTAVLINSNPNEIVSYQAAGYRYSILPLGEAPPAGFEQPDFDDAAWNVGAAAFGNGGGCPLQRTVRTTWPTSTQLLVRRELTLPCSMGGLQIFVAIDNDIEAIYFNGVQITGRQPHDGCPEQDSLRFSVPASLLRAGRNVVTYHLSDRGAESLFDARILATNPISTFDTDTENWTIVGDGTGPFYQPTGGNPGGYISSEDQALGSIWYWRAPAKFLGDQATAYGQNLQFDLKQSPTDRPTSTQPDIILEGAGLRMVFDFPNNPGASFTSYSVPLLETAGWTKDSLAGPAPTAAEMQAVLGTLTDLQIRGEYRDGPDTGGLDNVRLNLQTRYDAVKDFRLGQNPNGVWSYGYATTRNEPFNLMTETSSDAQLEFWRATGSGPYIVHNKTSSTVNYATIVQPPDVLNLDPSNDGRNSVLRWTAPAAGTYTLRGRFEGIDNGRGTSTDVAILHNGTELLADVVNGFGATVPFTLNFTAAAGDTIDFSVGKGANDSLYDSTGVSAIITQNTTSGPDLSVSQTASPDPVRVGDDLTYTVTVNNTGGDSTGVVLRDRLPEGVEFVSASSSQGAVTHANGIVTANLENLASNGSATVTIVVKPQTAGTLVNQVEVSDGACDADTSNNQSTLTTRVREVSGDIAIVRNFDDPAIGQMQSYLTEMGLTSQVFDQGLSFSDIQDFDIVIWEDLGFGSSGLADNEVLVFKQAFDAGIRLYLIGDDLAFSESNLSDNVRPIWRSLLHLSGTGNFGGNNQVTIVDQNHPVTNGPFGVVNDFSYSTDTDDALRTNTGEVLLGKSGDHDVILAVEAIGGNPRTVTQNTTVSKWDQTPTSLAERKKLFQNAIIWLLDVPQVRADLAVTQTVSPASVPQGDEATFTITVTNDGPDTARTVTLFDRLPSGATLVSNSVSQGEITSTPESVTVELGDLAKDASATLTIHLALGTAGTSTNTAHVTTLTRDLNLTNNESNQDVEVVASGQNADVAIAIAPEQNPVAAGQELSYILTVTNNGSGTASSVQLTQTLPDGATFVSATPEQGTASQQNGTVTADLGTLESGAQTQVNVIVRPDTQGSITSTATVAAQETDFVPGNNQASQSTQVTAPAAELGVTLSGAPEPVRAGQNLTFTAIVTNNGPETATSVVLADVLPAGLTFVSATASQGTVAQADGTVTANLGDLVSGESADVTIAVATSASATVLNTVRVESEQSDPVADNNSATVVSSITPRQADLSLTKTASASSVSVGSTLTYTLTVRNSGPDTADNVRVLDPLPEGVTFISANASQGTATQQDGVVSASLGTLANGATATVTVEVTANTAGDVVNIAGVNSNADDLDIDNNRAQQSTTVLNATPTPTPTPIPTPVPTPTATPTATPTVAPTPTTAPPADCADDVTALVRVTRSNALPDSYLPGLFGDTGRYSQSVVLRNTGNTPISGPVALVLDNLVSGATLLDADGVTGCEAPFNNPFATVGVGSDNVLSPGEEVNLTLSFDSSTSNITWLARVLAGVGRVTGPPAGTPPSTPGGGQPELISLNGRVTTGFGFALGGVDVILTDNAGATRRMVTDSSGAYRFTGIPPGTYDIRPVFTGLNFNPPSRSLNALSNTRQIDFFAFTSAVGPSSPLPPSPIADPLPATPPPSVMPTATPVPRPTATTGPTVTPTPRPTASAAQVPLPSASPLPPAGATPVSIRRAISGTIATSTGFGLRTVVVTLIDESGDRRSVQTDSGGRYRFTDVVPGTYTVIPSYPGLSFLPPMRTSELRDRNIDGVDFVAQVMR